MLQRLLADTVLYATALGVPSQDLLLFYLVGCGKHDFLESGFFPGIPERWRGSYSRTLISQVCIISKGTFSKHEWGSVLKVDEDY